MKKYFIVGDEHGRGKFIANYKAFTDAVGDNQDARIVCMGDYFDPYEHRHFDDMRANFMDICEIARKDSRVILLLGNHDTAYLLGDSNNRKDRFRTFEIVELFRENIDLFKLAIFPEEDTAISHAGITNTWAKKVEELTGKTVFDINELVPDFIKAYDNEDVLKTNLMWELFSFYRDDYSGYGDDIHQSCQWVRIPSLMKDSAFSTQIIGHTISEDCSVLQSEDKKITIVNTDSGMNESLTKHVEVDFDEK